MKLEHRNEAKEHMHLKYDAKVMHTNVIAQAEVTYQAKVNQLVEAHAKEVNLLKDFQAADLSELCWSHTPEIADLKHGFEETWIAFCEHKEREKVMIRQEYEERANQQTTRLTLLEKEMVSRHRRHLKDYNQHKHTADKEKDEAALVSIEQYVNKYKTGRRKWKRMTYDVFLVKTLRPALIAHVKHHVKECV
jgi:predicted mannosyl-3-phosphoglycerate phosphatase (HAD superfamily)